MNRFLANENFPKPSVILLRKNNLDVSSILENFPGTTDKNVIQLAVNEDRIILTLDRDYGELVFRFPDLNPPSVVYFRGTGNNPEYCGMILLQLIQNKIDLKNYFTVVDDAGIRQRKLK